MYQKIKNRIFEILEIPLPGDNVSKFVNIFIMSLIILNVICVILETVDYFFIRYASIFRLFDIFSVAVFTIEYIFRIWSCTSRRDFSHPIKGRIRFGLRPLILIDLLAVIPFYLPMLITLDLRFMRVIRLIRLFRLFKLARYISSMRLIGNVIREHKEELIITGFVGGLLLLLASGLIYFIENPAQPETFSSIPATMWWGVATLTTVGYGDIYPITPMGKLLGAMIAILGVAMFALPAGIISSGFIKEVQKQKAKKMVCPHCGKSIDVS